MQMVAFVTQGILPKPLQQGQAASCWVVSLQVLKNRLVKLNYTKADLIRVIEAWGHFLLCNKDQAIAISKNTSKLRQTN